MAADNHQPGSDPSLVTSHQSLQSGPQPPHTDDEISLLDILIVLAKHKKIMLGLPSVVLAVATCITLLMPNIYTGRAVLMPPQQQQSSATAMLGALAGIAGSGLCIKNPADLYVGMLQSRTVVDALIEHFHLKSLYDEDTLVDTRKELEKLTSITSGKDGLIIIEVDDEDAQRAADMANMYVEQLENLTSRLAVTEAGQRRLFFEKQLLKAKDDLAKAEVGLKETQERTGLVQLDNQGRVMIEAVATLRAQIVAREVQLAAIRSYATENNPEFIKTAREMESIRAELRKLEKGAGAGADLTMPTREIPAAGLAYARKLRDVRYYETIFELMAKQFEMAKIDEAQDVGVIQVLDKAIRPDRKSKPKRVLIILACTVVAALFGFFLAFALDFFERNYRTPFGRERLRMPVSGTPTAARETT